MTSVGVDASVDRARHQGHAARLRRIAAFRHDCGGCQNRDTGLTNRYNVGPCAQYLQERDQVIDEIVEAEMAVSQAHVARIVPIGDVDVVVGEHCFYGAAQQCREVSRHRGDEKDARLGFCEVLLEAQQCAKRRAMNLDLAHRDPLGADRDAVDAIGGTMVAEAGTGDDLAESGNGPLKDVSRHSGQGLRERRGRQIGNRPHRAGHIAISLKTLIDHPTDRTAPIDGRSR